MGSDIIARKSLVLAGMGSLLGEGGRADTSGELLHLRSAASAITEQLSKENRWTRQEQQVKLGSGNVGISFPGRGVTVYRVNLQLGEN